MAGGRQVWRQRQLRGYHMVLRYGLIRLPLLQSEAADAVGIRVGQPASVARDARRADVAPAGARHAQQVLGRRRGRQQAALGRGARLRGRRRPRQLPHIHLMPLRAQQPHRRRLVVVAVAGRQRRVGHLQHGALRAGIHADRVLLRGRGGTVGSSASGAAQAAYQPDGLEWWPATVGAGCRGADADTRKAVAGASPASTP